MTTKNKELAIHPFAPLNPEGLLPPGLSEDHVASAYRSYRKDLRPKKILKLLGVNDQPAATKRDLRREMNDPKSRRGQGHDGTTTDVPPLFDILYLWLKQQQWATNAYEGIVKPAEVTAGDRVFLDARQFDAEVKTCAESLEGVSESLERLSSPEALALFALAYALLQPDRRRHSHKLDGIGSQFRTLFRNRQRVLACSRCRGRGHFFGNSPPEPRPDADVAPRAVLASTAAYNRKLHEALQTLRLDIQSCGKTLVEAGTRITTVPHLSVPQQHLRVWGARWRGRREQLHQWTAVE